MTKLATRSNKLSGVLAFEEMPEYGVCRNAVTVTMEAGMDVGAVVQLNGGVYTWVAAADVATLNADVRVVIETTKYVPSLAAGAQTMVVLSKGHAGVVDKGLLFKGAALSDAQKLTVYTALRAKNIHVRPQA